MSKLKGEWFSWRFLLKIPEYWQFLECRLSAATCAWLAAAVKSLAFPAHNQTGRKTNSPGWAARDKSILSLGLEHLYFPQFACWENHFPIFSRRIWERAIAWLSSFSLLLLCVRSKSWKLCHPPARMCPARRKLALSQFAQVISPLPLKNASFYHQIRDWVCVEESNGGTIKYTCFAGRSSTAKCPDRKFNLQ